MTQSSTTFHIGPLQLAHAEQVCQWVFDPPYNIYNWLPWEQMQQLGVEFGDPVLREQQYASVLTENGELIGIAQYFPMQDVTRLGVCMRPEVCGLGYGAAFMETIVQEAIRRTPNHEIDLEVHIWNKRAIRAYEKAGFAITDTYDKRTPTGIAAFHCMVWQGK